MAGAHERLKMSAKIVLAVTTEVYVLRPK